MCQESTSTSNTTPIGFCVLVYYFITLPHEVLKTHLSSNLSLGNTFILDQSVLPSTNI